MTRHKVSVVSVADHRETPRGNNMFARKDVNLEENEEEDEEEDVFILNLIISLFSAVCENSAQSCLEVFLMTGRWQRGKGRKQLTG